jgi:hypothetical protein
LIDLVEKHLKEEAKAVECEICRKSFKCRQALGGHKKVHFHTKNKKNNNDFSLYTNKVNCDNNRSINTVASDVCTKEFPSIMSLSWHKGMDHPSKEPQVKGKQNNSGLTKYLPPGWLKTGKRGRKDNFYTEEASCAANTLMLLSSDTRVCGLPLHKDTAIEDLVSELDDETIMAVNRSNKKMKSAMVRSKDGQ